MAKLTPEREAEIREDINVFAEYEQACARELLAEVDGLRIQLQIALVDRVADDMRSQRDEALAKLKTLAVLFDIEPEDG